MPDTAHTGTPSGAVFLSYASQDAKVAKRVSEALRAAGIEVWFDQSELRGGDAWDQSIRKQIKNCALFMPIISAHTQTRLEGYFRLEWKLAEDRSHLMAKGKAFIVPVTVDGTGDQEAQVPDAFLAVQWTKLPGGETPPGFGEQVKKLLGSPLGDCPLASLEPWQGAGFGEAIAWPQSRGC
ncbi:MAG: toll/interleukin-1 receptor domain-containing protein [Opitutaceae bacterium]